MIRSAIVAVGVVITIGAIVYVAGLRFPMPAAPLTGVTQHEGRWVWATFEPQICYAPQGSGYVSTGWDKMKDKDIWYRVIGEPYQNVTVEELRASGHVSYPGETPEQTRQRRERLGEYSGGR